MDADVKFENPCQNTEEEEGEEEEEEDGDPQEEEEEEDSKMIVEDDAVAARLESTEECLSELERLVTSQAATGGRGGVAVVRRYRGEEGEQFLQVTDVRTDADTYFSHLVLVVEVGREDTVFRLLAPRNCRLIKEVAVSRLEEKQEQESQLRTTVAHFLAELEADRYEACQGAFDEESFVGDFSGLDVRSVLVDTSSAGVVYRARNCPALLPKEAGEVCEACLHLREAQQHNLEQEEEEEGGVGMLSQYLEVSMGDDSTEPDLTDQHQQQQRRLEEPIEVKPKMQQVDLRRAGGGLPQQRHHRGQVFKPKLSYKKLISMAIKDSHFKMLKLTDIYAWILARYPSFNSNRTGFQNSVRHNLSLNKVFIKVNMPGVANNGKGNYWTINPKFEDPDNKLIERRGHMVRPRNVNFGANARPTPPHLPPHPSPQANNCRALMPTAGGGGHRWDSNGNTGTDTSLGEEEEGEAGGRDLKALLPDNPNITISLQPRQHQLPAHRAHDFSDGLVLEKPNFSYKELIMIAIFCEPSLQVTLADIYLTIKHWFPYYQQRGVGLTWQNSVRHNLSLNKCFRRLAPPASPLGGRLEANRTLSSKGGNWTFSEADETWRRLVTTPKKWLELRTANNGSSEGLLHFLAGRSAEFRKFVFSKIFTAEEMELLGLGHIASEEEAAIVSGSEGDSKQELLQQKHHSKEAGDLQQNADFQQQKQSHDLQHKHGHGQQKQTHDSQGHDLQQTSGQDNQQKPGHEMNYKQEHDLVHQKQNHDLHHGQAQNLHHKIPVQGHAAHGHSTQGHPLQGHSPHSHHPHIQGHPSQVQHPSHGHHVQGHPVQNHSVMGHSAQSHYVQGHHQMHAHSAVPGHHPHGHLVPGHAVQNLHQSHQGQTVLSDRPGGERDYSSYGVDEVGELADHVVKLEGELPQA